MKSEEINLEIIQLARTKLELETEAAALVEKMATKFNATDATRRSTILQQLQGLEVANNRLAEAHKQALISEELAELVADIQHNATEHAAPLPELEKEIGQTRARLQAMIEAYQAHKGAWENFQRGIPYRAQTAQKDPEGFKQLLQIINENQIVCTLMNEPGGWGRG